MTDILKRADSFTLSVLEKFDPPEGELPGLLFLLGKLIHILLALGELSIWTGLSGHGKSLFLNQACLDALRRGMIVAIASFEMSAKKTLYRMVRQALGAENPEDWLIIQCLEWLGPRVWIYDHVGRANVEHLLKAFHRAACDQGVTHFVIDSLMKCGIAEDDYNGQKSLVDRLQNFAQKDNVHVHLVAHSRKKADESESPGKMDVRGAASITDLADNVFSIWRNKKKENAYRAYEHTGELPSGMTIEKLMGQPDSLLDCLKHRELGGDAEGRYGLYYHRASMQFMERNDAKPLYYFQGERP
jgi:twinkle protein